MVQLSRNPMLLHRDVKGNPDALLLVGSRKRTENIRRLDQLDTMAVREPDWLLGQKTQVSETNLGGKKTGS